MANSNSIPWAQNPEYLEMSRTHPQPGDLTAYDPPRLIGASPTDVTTFKAGHSRLTLHNLPNVLYVIEPTDEWKQHRALAKPPQKIDPVTEQPLFEHAPRPNTTPRPLLDWPVLRGIEKVSKTLSQRSLELLLIDSRLVHEKIGYSLKPCSDWSRG